MNDSKDLFSPPAVFKLGLPRDKPCLQKIYECMADGTLKSVRLRRKVKDRIFIPIESIDEYNAMFKL